MNERNYKRAFGFAVVICLLLAVSLGFELLRGEHRPQLAEEGDPVVAKPWIASSIAELEPDYRPLAEAFAAEWLKASGESNGVPPEVFEEEVKRTFKDNIRSIFQLFRFGNSILDRDVAGHLGNRCNPRGTLR